MTIVSTSPAVPNRAEHWTEPREARETGDRLRGDDDGPRKFFGGRLRFSQVGLDVFDRLLQLLDRPSLTRTAHVRDLCQDVEAVAWQVLSQVIHLPHETPAGEAGDREHERDHREHGGDAADPPLKPGDGRSQEEGQQDREGDRHEHGLRPVQDQDNEHTPGKRQHWSRVPKGTDAAGRRTQDLSGEVPTMTLTLPTLLVLIVIALICGAVGKALAGGARGGMLTSIALGFIGALFGPWVARQLNLSEPFTLHLSGSRFRFSGRSSGRPSSWRFSTSSLGGGGRGTDRTLRPNRSTRCSLVHRPFNRRG